MQYDGGVGVAVATATTGIGAKMAADTKLSVLDRQFAAEYTAILAASANTSYNDDIRFKFIFDQWWILNMKTQQGFAP